MSVHTRLLKKYLLSKLQRNKNYKKISIQKKALQHQLLIHKNLIHPNIVKFIDVFQSSRNYYIIQELCQDGNLRSLLQKAKKFSEKDAITIITMICLAFSELLKAGILHRDLKPENLLLKKGIVKLADFGLSKKVKTFQQLNESVVGTLVYMSPQLLQGQKYSSKCDVWSLGIIFYELLFGKFPWKGDTMFSIVEAIKSSQLQFPQQQKITKNSKDFLQKVLQREEKDRLSWIQIYQHQLFTNNMITIAKQWRKTYQRVLKTLQNLSYQVHVQQLIGVFFQFKLPFLDYQKFTQVMKWLIADVKQTDLGVMYQFFDKDLNGVIDIQQFVNGFNLCQSKIPKLIRILLEKQINFKDLQNKQYFLNLSQDFEQQTVKKAYEIISHITLE